ncbi:hypothetical protein ACHAWF_002362 [Thalassiosira exigua]
MVGALPFSALLLSSSAAFASAQLPSNDLCTTATDITTWPFDSAGSVEFATPDSWSHSCFGESSLMEQTSVWYKIEGVPVGTELHAGCKGRSIEVQCEVMMSTKERGLCPDEFLCVEQGMNVASSVSRDHPIPDISYEWVAEEGAIYYIFLYAPKDNTTGSPEFTLRVSRKDMQGGIVGGPIITTASDAVDKASSSGVPRNGHPTLSFIWGALLWAAYTMSIYYALGN